MSSSYARFNFPTACEGDFITFIQTILEDFVQEQAAKATDSKNAVGPKTHFSTERNEGTLHFYSHKLGAVTYVKLFLPYEEEENYLTIGRHAEAGFITNAAVDALESYFKQKGVEYTLTRC